jgi:hypothetical protein
MVTRIKIYRAIFLYGCEAWSLIPRKRNRLRLFENCAERKEEKTEWWGNVHI